MQIYAENTIRIVVSAYFEKGKKGSYGARKAGCGLTYRWGWANSHLWSMIDLARMCWDVQSKPPDWYVSGSCILPDLIPKLTTLNDSEQTAEKKGSQTEIAFPTEMQKELVLSHLGQLQNLQRGLKCCKYKGFGNQVPCCWSRFGANLRPTK